MQHGGNIRLYKKTLHHFIESRISDKFLIWGTKKSNKKEIFFPSTRLDLFKEKYNIRFVNKYKYCIVFEPFRKFNINFFKINSPLEYLKKYKKIFDKKNINNFIVKTHYEKQNKIFSL